MAGKLGISQGYNRSFITHQFGVICQIAKILKWVHGWYCWSATHHDCYYHWRTSRWHICFLILAISRSTVNCMKLQFDPEFLSHLRTGNWFKQWAGRVLLGLLGAKSVSTILKKQSRAQMIRILQCSILAPQLFCLSLSSSLSSSVC